MSDKAITDRDELVDHYLNLPEHKRRVVTWLIRTCGWRVAAVEVAGNGHETWVFDVPEGERYGVQRIAQPSLRWSNMLPHAVAYDPEFGAKVRDDFAMYVLEQGGNPND